jgi:hypothetical protein
MFSRRSALCAVAAVAPTKVLVVVKPAAQQSRCSGIIEGFIFVGKDVGVCAPKASMEKSVRAVVQFIENRPARMNDDFRPLALEALRAAWPCKN